MATKPESSGYRNIEKAKEAEEIASKVLGKFVIKSFEKFIETTKSINDGTIRQHHRNSRPAFTNRTKEDFQDPFQICKCFMPYGNRKLNSIGEADFYVLITVIFNFLPFKKRLSESLYIKVREQAQRIHETSSLTEQELSNYFDRLVQLIVALKDVDHEDKSISQAEEKLEKMIRPLEPPVYKRYIFPFAAWNTCIKKLSREEAFKLLESAQLPDRKTLDKLCQYDAFGRTSDVAIAVCVKICAFIKSFDPAITDVWASRKAIHLKEKDKFEIKFVVITEKLEQKSMDDLQDRIQSYYDVLRLRDCDGFSKEEEEALMKYKDKELDDEARAKIKACLSNNASQLLQKHTYLSIISGCPYRSSGYGKNHDISNTPCIVLNVQYKGYIPFDEEPFNSEYDGVKVDVREDAFILFNQTAQERQDYVKAGCLISGEKDESGRPAGTLGGFVIHPDYGLCGLSCSHALLSPSRLKEMSKEGQIDWSLPVLPTKHSDTQINVYQPSKYDTDEDENNDVNAEKNKIGQVVKVIYRSGNAGSEDMDGYGMDVALFQISKRLPKSTDFPVVQDTPDSAEGRKIHIQYASGAVAGFAWHDEKASFSKYGAATGYTVGKLSSSGISCKSTCKWTYKKEFNFILHNQVCFRKDEENESHILPYKRSPESTQRLAWKGDSGSLMFRESDGNVVCVGIVEGGSKKQRKCYVTPVLPVLKAMGITEFKNFESERM